MTTKDLRNNIEKVLGNNIRCLLPSYWWKRLFHQVADTIDDVNGVDIVSSESALNRLDAPIGSLASIANKKTMKPSECYVPTDEDSNLTDEELVAKLTRLTSLEVSFPLPDITGVEATAVLVGEDAGGEGAWLGFLAISEGFCAAMFVKSTSEGGQKVFLLTSQSSVNSLNTFLKQHKFYYVGLDFEPEDTEEYIKETTELFDQIFTIVDCNSDVYVKGVAWERLAKEGESGKEGEGDTRIPSYLLYYPYTTRNGVYTMHESFIEHNATELPKIKNSINNKEGYILNVVAAGTSATDVQTMQDVDFHYLGYGTGNTGGLVVITSQFIPVYRAVQPNRLFLGFKEDGSCEVKEIAVGDTLYLYYSEDYGFNFTDAEKAANAENIIPIWNSLDESFTPRPIIIRHKVNDTPSGSGNYLSIPAVLTGVDTTGMNITLVGCYSPSRFLEYQYNRTTGEFLSLKEIVPDAELSDASTNPVQNKVIKAYVDTEVAKKVDKVSGKGLSTEDFTTLLKTKLEGLENYDDTTLTNAINSLETRLNTLVSGDTSTAIESFNEVIAFLENLTDTQDLSSIIASIEQQINAKQDKINDLEDIRSGASLGKTSLQEHQDISHLATKEEVQNVVDDILENEEIYAAAVNDLNNRVTTTDTLLATETTNRESLQTEFQNFKTQVTDNEEVWATSLIDINTRIDNNYQYGEDTYTTKESLNTEIQAINTTILDNEEVIAATLTDLNNQIAALNALITDLTTRIETLENA